MTTLDPSLVKFIRNSIRSIWTLELLLFMRSHAPETWSVKDIVRELRASDRLVIRFMAELEAAGLLVCDPGAGCRFAPATPLLESLCTELDRAYRERPFAVMRVVVEHDRLRDFANAFRLRNDG